MNQDYVGQLILQVAKAISVNVPSAKWYGFGSYYLGNTLFGDIDILVVAQSLDDCSKVYSLSREICGEWPIDLLILTLDEENETSFIEKKKCIPLW